MFNVKIVSKSATNVIKFDTSQERKQWLLSNGFGSVNGVWKHIDGTIAGVFHEADSEAIKRNSNVQIKDKSIWSMFNKKGA